MKAGAAYISCFLLLAMWSQGLWAWSAKGHEEIAKQAFLHLTTAQQNAIENVLIQGRFISKDQKQKAKELGGAWLLGQAATWPDEVRREQLSILYKRYTNVHVSQKLLQYQSDDTAAWHYSNALFTSGKGTQQQKTPVSTASSLGGCKIRSSGELFNAWPKLIRAYKDAQSVSEKALLVAFISHLAADAYQPLHVLSSINKQCQHDLGGNAYCLKPATGFLNLDRRCELNLHRVWDGGFGIFDSFRAFDQSEVAGLSIDYLVNHPQLL